MSNLPPGVNVNMIPGNRPEDAEEEAWWGTFEETCDEKRVTIPADLLDAPWFVGAIGVARELAYAEGYNDGASEERMKLNDGPESAD